LLEETPARHSPRWVIASVGAARHGVKGRRSRWRPLRWQGLDSESQPVILPSHPCL